MLSICWNLSGLECSKRQNISKKSKSLDSRRVPHFLCSSDEKGNHWVLLCILRPCSVIFFEPSALFVFCHWSDTSGTAVLTKVLIFLLLHHSVHKDNLNVFEKVAFLILGTKRKERKLSQILENLHWSKQTQQKYYRDNRGRQPELSGSYPHPSEHRLWLALAANFRGEPDLESSRVFWFKVLVWSHLHSQQQDNNFWFSLFVKKVITCLGFQKCVLFLQENK